VQQVLAKLPSGLSQAALLGVVQEDAFVAKLFPKNSVLRREISYRILLLPIHPASNGHRK